MLTTFAEAASNLKTTEQTGGEMGLEQHTKTEHDEEEKQQQPESEHNDNNAIDPMLDRSVSCYSVATSPSPKSTPSPSFAEVSGHTPRWSMISASPRSGAMSAQLSFPDHHSPDHSDASPMQSPSPQSTGVPAGYDPKRIPSSIFSSKSAAAADWSAASNESLFSIHVGNGSFSKEELSERKSLSSLPPLAEVSADYEGKDWKMSDASQVKGVVEAPKPGSANATPASQGYSPSPRNSNAPQIAPFQSPRLSNGSVNSCQSFAFPV